MLLSLNNLGPYLFVALEMSSLSCTLCFAVLSQCKHTASVKTLLQIGRCESHTNSCPCFAGNDVAREPVRQGNQRHPGRRDGSRQDGSEHRISQLSGRGKSHGPSITCLRRPITARNSHFARVVSFEQVIKNCFRRTTHGDHSWLWLQPPLFTIGSKKSPDLFLHLRSVSSGSYS